MIGNPASFGTINDSMVGKVIGDIIDFAAERSRYTSDGNIIDVSSRVEAFCTDHVIAWKVRRTALIQHGFLYKNPEASLKYCPLLGFCKLVAAKR